MSTVNSPSPQGEQAISLLLLADQDNCLVACRFLAKNSVVDIDQQPVQLANDIQIAHKVARIDIAAGAKILKYGAIIGSATADIKRGEHIHLHNMQSDYLPTLIIRTRIEVQEL